MDKLRKISIVIAILVIANSTASGVIADSNVEEIMNLVMEIKGNTPYADICLFLAQQLREIGINLEIKVYDPIIVFGYWLIPRTYDLFLEELAGWGSPDMRDLFTEEGSQNNFGLNRDFPYVNESEQLLNAAVTELAVEKRIQLYHSWQEITMDKVVPIIPLFAPRFYSVLWANTLGYDMLWGLDESLPYMSYEGYHEGQENLSEFVLANYNWHDLNPLFLNNFQSWDYYPDKADFEIIDFITEPILQVDPENTPLFTGLIMNWDMIDPFHYKFYMRDNVYFNPSFNITTRNRDSGDLLNSPLLVGLKGGSSNGTNQQVQAKDTVFTILAAANPICSDLSLRYNWITDCYVDANNSLAFHIEIDGDPNTVEKEGYTDFWSLLNIPVLPEFFLNSTSPNISYTTGGIQCTGLYPEIVDTPQWILYSVSPFGNGKYMLDYYIRNSVTVLQKSPFWFRVGALDGTYQDLAIDTLKVKVMPDPRAQLAEFKAGKLDITDLTPFPNERNDPQINIMFNLQSCVKEEMTYIGFNLLRPTIGGVDNYIYSEVPGKENYTVACAVRKAISYAADREEMNNNLYDGEYQMYHTPMNPYWTMYYYSDIPIKYNHNIDLAWDWLVAAGFPSPSITYTLLYPQLSLTLAVVFLYVFYRKKRKISS